MYEEMLMEGAKSHWLIGDLTSYLTANKYEITEVDGALLLSSPVERKMGTMYDSLVAKLFINDEEKKANDNNWIIEYATDSYKDQLEALAKKMKQVFQVAVTVKSQESVSNASIMDDFFGLNMF